MPNPARASLAPSSLYSVPTSWYPPSLLQKKPSTVSQRSVQSHLSAHTASGGSSSSGSSTKSGITLPDAYNAWRKADDALQRLPSELRDREECDRELATARKMVDNLQSGHSGDLSRSPRVRRKASRKPSLFTIMGKSKSTLHLPFQDVPEPEPMLEDELADLQDAARRASELERESYKWAKQIEVTKALAATLDPCYDMLKQALDSGPLPSWRFAEGNEQAIIRTEKTVAAREKSFEDSAATTEALKRARVAIQSAHHHYTQAMDLLDTVCGPKRGGWVAAMGDEQSKAQTYREAAEWSKKAQICFNECMRVLKPHLELLDSEQVAASEQLKEAGLTQGVRLYDLMYGGKTLDFGITQMVQTMVHKLTAVYGYLTTFAVGVQECAKNCESVQENERHSRDVARRELVAHWMTDVDAAPSSPQFRRQSHLPSTRRRQGTAGSSMSADSQWSSSS